MNKGVYIIDLDGRLYKISDWDKGSEATGVALVTDKVSIIIAKDEWYSTSNLSAWGGHGSTIYDIDKIQSDEVVIDDFNGSSNTDAIIFQLKGVGDIYKKFYIGAPAAEYCRAYSCGCKGEGSWYLPSAGEYNEIVINHKSINVALRAIDGVPLYKNDWIWVSAQFSSSRAWGYNWKYERFRTNPKYFANGVRPICKL